MAQLHLIHGPNLNLLGNRENSLYGHLSLNELNQNLEAIADKLGHHLMVFQSNSEGALIDTIGQSKADIILLNPAGFTHTSIALRDALLGVQIPFIEIHLSNIDKREDFRKTSYFSDIAIGVISGFKEQSYTLALHAADHYLKAS